MAARTHKAKDFHARLERDARRIFAAAVKSASPREAVLRHLHIEGDFLIAGRRRYPLADLRRIFVVGAGKASAAMAQAVEKLLGRRIHAGAVTVKHGHSLPLKRITLLEASHPVPDEAGVHGALAIRDLAASAEASDLVIALISGGASALMVLPAEGITLAEKQETTRLLLACGASIHEMNAVRKHLSQLKGGLLAHACAPARVLALLLSDVIGDDLDVIGSGPAAPDSSSFASALEVLERYRLAKKVPRAVRERLRQGAAGKLPETPKPGQRLFDRVQNLVVGSNALAVDEAAKTARSLGYRPLVLTTRLDGEAREQARMLAAIAREAQDSGRPARAPLCILAGGETVVTLRGKGLGGRNQEFALAAALALEGTENIAILAGGTDGTDGPTDAAGAVITGHTSSAARRQGLSPELALAANDSYAFFRDAGGHIHTGPTGTNVMDLYMALVCMAPAAPLR